MTEPTPVQHLGTASNGTRVEAWACPVEWHRYVKWNGDQAYCIELGCWHGSADHTGGPQ